MSTLKSLIKIKMRQDIPIVERYKQLQQILDEKYDLNDPARDSLIIFAAEEAMKYEREKGTATQAKKELLIGYITGEFAEKPIINNHN